MEMKCELWQKSQITYKRIRYTYIALKSFKEGSEFFAINRNNSSIKNFRQMQELK